ncbi:MAG: sulfatase-like hydrolase/transferase [Deltaproteobacteria bacterium]|nr:sulfatase-like hydrolase/transferase [Deltaproteobacteria bacterium]
MRKAIVAGSVGGAITGALDAWVVVGGGHAPPPELHRRLALVCTASGAVAGLLGAIAVWAAFQLVLRIVRRFGGKVPSDWAGAIAPTLLAAPLVLWVGRSLFKGGKASQIPGRQVLSFLVIVMGFAAVAWFGRWQTRALIARNRRTIQVLLFLFAAFCLSMANGYLLPRLYPWMHQALSVGTFATAILAVAHLLAQPNRLVLGASVVAVIVSAAVGYEQLVASTELRFVALERTVPTREVLRHVPMRSRRVLTATNRPFVDRSSAANEPLPPGPTMPQASVLLITIDALRPDHVGAYGYTRNTTPNIDRIAARGTRFERAYAQAPHTSFSVASMLTGKYYATLSRLSKGSIEEPFPTLLRTYGWRTAAFYPPAVFFVDGEKLAGFRDSHFQFEYVKFEFLSAQGRIAQLREYYAGIGDGRVFVWVHFFEPHEPYELHAGHDFGPSEQDRYDSEIAYTDHAVGTIVSDFEARRPGSLVIISADHGEEFDDHGGRYHGTTLYDEQIRVPLIMAGPGIATGVVGGPVELVDLAPTIGGLLGMSLPARMRGTDLGPWLMPSQPPSDRLGAAFAELGSQRMMVESQHKLLCRMDVDLCQLFDLAADPKERKNLADLQPGKVIQMRAKMDSWVKAQLRLEPAGEADSVPAAILRGRLGDATAAEGLLALVMASAEGTRDEAARVLAQLTLDPRHWAAIRTAHDAVPAGSIARKWLALAGLRAGDASWRDEVATVARLGAAEPMGLQAALTMAELGGAEGLTTLSASLSGDACGETAQCRRVAEALGRLRRREAVPALLARVPDVMTRREVVEALGTIADTRAQSVLIDRLRSDEYVPVRAAAATALGRLPGAVARAALVRAAAIEQEVPVRDAIRAALSVDHSLRP